MSAPVDVLAAIDRSVEGHEWEQKRLVRAGDAEGARLREFALQELRDARAAVAELIEADKEYDEADTAWHGERYEQDNYGVDGSEFARCLDCENESGAGVLNKGVSHFPGCRVERLEKAITRRTAALARVGGAA